MQAIKHPSCNKDAFYVRGFPIGRPLMPQEAMDKEGTTLIAMGNRVECVSCGKKVDFKEVNDYYDIDADAG